MTTEMTSPENSSKKMDYETTKGIVGVVADTYCRVVAQMGELAEELKVNRCDFYMFGVVCDGELSNIVESGDEVNVGYRLGPQNIPFVVAVWIGDKPHCLNKSSGAIYDQEGVVLHIDDANMIARTDDFTVIFSRDVVYKNGRLLRQFDVVNLGQCVKYDAIPEEDPYSGASFLGTCAWIGAPGPPLKDRFKYTINVSLDSETTATFEDKSVVGIVEAIPNDVTAIVDLPDVANDKALLFRSSLDVECCSLKDVISVGDRLYLQLRCDIMNQEKLWFVTKASKVSVDNQPVVHAVTPPATQTLFEAVTQPVVQTVSQSVVQTVTQPVTQSVVEAVTQPVVHPVTTLVTQSVVEPVTQSVVEPVTQPVVHPVTPPVTQSLFQAVTQPKVQPVRTPVVQPMSRVKTELLDEEDNGSERSNESSLLSANVNAQVKKEMLKVRAPAEINASAGERTRLNTPPVPRGPLQSIRKCVPFKKSWPSEGRSFLLDWPSIANLEGKNKRLRIDYTFGSISVRIEDPLITSCVGNVKSFKQLQPHELGYMFFLELESRSNTDFRVKRMWRNNGIPPVKTLIKSQLKYENPLTSPTRCYFGKVKSLPFYDTALVSVGDVSVLVTLKSLVTEEEINAKWCTMTMFLDIGVSVFMVVRRCHFNTGQNYYAAEKCWKVTLMTDGREVEKGPEELPKISWNSIWATGEYFQEGILVQRNDQNFVRVSDDFQTKLIELDKVLLHKSFKETSGLEGQKVTFHVRYVSSGSVAWGWLGETPPVCVFLRDKLIVPEKIVDENKYYEAIIDEFPLPTHAICKIGAVPVLLLLTPVTENGRFVGVTERVDLFIGARISVRVKEEKVDLGAFLVAETYSLGGIYSGAVLVNFTGYVAQMPCPVGMIETDGHKVQVSFELCCVRAAKTKSFHDLSSWREYVKERVKVGTRVRVTALQNGDNLILLRAIEVWIDQ